MIAMLEYYQNRLLFQEKHQKQTIPSPVHEILGKSEDLRLEGNKNLSLHRSSHNIIIVLNEPCTHG